MRPGLRPGRTPLCPSRLIFYAADIEGVRLIVVVDAGAGGAEEQVVRAGALELGS